MSDDRPTEDLSAQMPPDNGVIEDDNADAMGGAPGGMFGTDDDRREDLDDTPDADT